MIKTMKICFVTYNKSSIIQYDNDPEFKSRALNGFLLI